MRALILVLLFSCTQAIASEFSISGLKIGDKVHDINAYGLCPPADGPLTECLTITELAGGEALITYYFNGDKLSDASIAFDAKKFSKMVNYYKEQFGAEPTISKEPIIIDDDELTNKIAVWKINGGEFVVQKYKSYKKGIAYIVPSPHPG